MGCTPSKQSVCRNCNAQFSPVRRSYSSHPHHSPPRDTGDHRHLVALTSTTLGYLQLDSSKPNQEDFAKMINEKITKIAPETPIRTNTEEPETINTWELMEGLDDSSPNLQPPSTVDHIRCFSYNVIPNSIAQDKPLWLQFKEKHSDLNSNSSNTSDFDPNNVNRKPGEIVDGVNENMSCGKDKLVLYFTSLRGVRKTYEDCCHVRVILKSSGFRVDERDVSMHSGFKEELKELLGDRFGGGGLLPKVFVGKKYIGGAEEIRRLHDEFQLDKVFDGCEMVDQGGRGAGGGGGGCQACGDVRFLPCEACSGSCKLYYEVDSDEGEKEEDDSDYGFQRCPQCNENGLVRCPICWD